MYPKQKPDDRPRRVTDALVNAMVAAHAGQRFAVIVWEKSIKRNGTRANSEELMVWSEQLDAHAPERFTMPNDPHSGA